MTSDTDPDTQEVEPWTTTVTPAKLWEIANDLRSAESVQKSTSERLTEYKEIRADLEELLAEAENRPLPDDHRNAEPESEPSAKG